VKISIQNKPLNHRRWKLIYLLVILLTLMFAPIGKADITNTVTRSERVEYHWPALQNYINLLRVRQLLYGKTPRQTKKAQIPDAEPTPYPPQVEKGRKRAREHLALKGAASRRLALLVRGQDHRGGNRTPLKSPPGKRAVYGQARQMLT
jgi:hypothetical protein